MVAESGCDMAEGKKAYREEKLKPPGWDPDKQSYGDWKFLVLMWVEACDRAKLPNCDRGYLLFQKLKDIEKDNIGNKLVAEAQLGVINVFRDDAVDKILEVLDTRFKEDDLALKKKAWKICYTI